MISSGIKWSASSFEAMCSNFHFEIPQKLNIAELVCDRNAQATPNAVALKEVQSVPGGKWKLQETTFRELQVLSNKFATVLREYGIGRGERVAVFLPQGLAAAVSHVAIQKIGAIGVPLSTLFRQEALKYRLVASGTKALITNHELRQYYDPIAKDLKDLALLFSTDKSDGALPFWPNIEKAKILSEMVSTLKDDPALLIFTSGTSGLPKGALHGHRLLPARLPGFELIHQLEKTPPNGRPFWTPADWSWIGGLVDSVFTPWVFGHSVISLGGRFDTSLVFPMLKEFNVRSAFLPPTALSKLRAHGDKGEALDCVIHTAGEALSPDIYEWASRVFSKVYDLYGMTEMGATIGSSPFVPMRPGALGKPYPGHRVELIDDSGQVLKGEAKGEIAIHRDNPGMFLRYWNDASGTQERFRNDFMVTGDMAKRDADGYLWYLGRNDDVFNTSGYRVGPAEIERAIEEHPHVERSAVVGMPDRTCGHVVKAFVLPTAGVQPSQDLLVDIQVFVKKRLAAFEYPKTIMFVRDLPTTVTGKIQRAVLREPDADERYGWPIK